VASVSVIMMVIMSEGLPTNSESLANWRLSSLRFTLFSDAPKAEGSGLFEDFFEITPDAETHRKAEFLSEFAAQKGSVVYQTIIAGPKVDFLVSVALTDAMQTGFPMLPQEGEFERQFQLSATRLVAKRNIVRVAVGAHYVQPVANKDKGYELLVEYLPGIRLDASSSDFQYRINRPRSIVCAGQEVRLNRLSTWSCLSVKVGVEVGGMSSPEVISSAVSVLTDVSTVPEQNYSNFTEQVKASVTGTLFQFSKEIAQKGDIA
jgi:hypothetical protein